MPTTTYTDATAARLAAARRSMATHRNGGTDPKGEPEKYRAEVAANCEALTARRAELAATAAERRSNPAAPAGPLMSRAMDDYRDAISDSGHIDHTPGGPPSLWLDANGNPQSAAPAPAVKHWVTSYVPYVKARRPGEPMGWTEAFNRCAAAARQEMPRGTSQDDVDDCTQQVVIALLRSVPGENGEKTEDSGRRTFSESIPEEWATMARLKHHAANYRRTTERHRARLAGEELEQRTHDAFVDGAEPTLADSPYGLDRAAAHRQARELLGNLGLPRLGRCYLLAYAACRMRQLDALLEPNANGRGGNGASAIVAAELGMTPGAYRIARMRAVEAAHDHFPAAPGTPEACLLRLGVDPHRDRGYLLGESSGASNLPANFAASAEKVRAHDAKRQEARDREGTRTAPGDRTPNARGRSAHYPPERRISYGLPGAHAPGGKPIERQVKPTASRVKVAGKMTTMRADKPAWTRGLTTGQHRWLATGAGMMRTRVAARSSAERTAARLAAGLPA